MMLPAMPNLAAIVDPILGMPYERYDCWALVRYLLKEGFDLDIEADAEKAAQQLHEVWFWGDTREPLALVQPWDCLLMCTRGVASNHLGLVVNDYQFVHTHKRVGVCLQRLSFYRPKLMQIVRLRLLV